MGAYFIQIAYIILKLGHMAIIETLSFSASAISKPHIEALSEDESRATFEVLVSVRHVCFINDIIILSS